MPLGFKLGLWAGLCDKAEMRVEADLNSLQNIYLESLVPPGSATWQAGLVEAREQSRRLSKEGISVSPVEGQFLRFLFAQLAGPRVVEIGTLTGYSALWILRGLLEASPEGPIEFATFENNPEHARIAREILQRVESPSDGALKIEVWEGDAREELQRWSQKNQGQLLDGIFIDGPKAAYGEFLDWAEKHLRPGALVVADNVFLRGQVFDDSVPGTFSAKQIQALRQFNLRLANPELYSAIFIPTVEGLAVARFLGSQSATKIV